MAVKNETEVLVETELTKEDEAMKKTASKKKNSKAGTAAAVKEETVKKAAPKKTVKKEKPEATVTIQYQNKEVELKQVLEAAKKAFKEANPEVEIKTINLYIKPEDGVAYYVVNGEGSGDYKVTL